jgi:hypothetical protein
MLISDQPILEDLVRSTKKSSISGIRKADTVRLTLVVIPLFDILKVVDPCIVVVLAGKQYGVEIARVSVGNGVTCMVSPDPSTW